MAKTQGQRGKKARTGAKGAVGKTGASGATGARGLKGARGTKGETGSTGARGPSGGSAVRTPQLGLAGVYDNIERIYQELDMQLQRMGQLHVELNKVRTTVQLLAAESK